MSKIKNDPTTLIVGEYVHDHDEGSKTWGCVGNVKEVLGYNPENLTWKIRLGDRPFFEDEKIVYIKFSTQYDCWFVYYGLKEQEQQIDMTEIKAWGEAQALITEHHALAKRQGDNLRNLAKHNRDFDNWQDKKEFSKARLEITKAIDQTRNRILEIEQELYRLVGLPE